MKTWSFLIVLGVLIAAGAADAATYRWMGPDGVVIYSDRPPQPGDLPKAAAAEAPAPAARAGARGAVDDLLARSGFKDQVAAIADRLRTEFHRRHGHLVAPDMTLAREISSARLRPEALYEAFVVEFAKRIDEERMADALVWFDSPAGRKITGLEGRAARARDGAAELGRFVARLRGEPTRPERVALVQRLDAGFTYMAFSAITRNATWFCPAKNNPSPTSHAIKNRFSPSLRKNTCDRYGAIG